MPVRFAVLPLPADDALMPVDGTVGPPVGGGDDDGDVGGDGGESACPGGEPLR